MGKTINALVKEIHENAVNHGWWDAPRSFGEIVALCHSELSEALEEDRAGRGINWRLCRKSGKPCIETECIDWETGEGCSVDMMSQKPEGIGTEMADCVIRIMDWAGHEGIDLEKLILEKMEYNRTRPYKHNKRY